MYRTLSEARDRQDELGLEREHVYTILEQYTMRPRFQQAVTRVRRRANLEYRGIQIGELVFRATLKDGQRRLVYVDPSDLVSVREIVPDPV